jgi:hypothetical protein
MLKWANYQRFIEDNLTIIDKDKQEVKFKLNRPQLHFIENSTDRNVILKARKMGFSSLLLAIAVAKFLLGRNEKCVSMSFDREASAKQLERAKHFLRSYDRVNGTNFMADKGSPLKYNSKNELVMEVSAKDDPEGVGYVNALRIGTAKSSSFGRGDDITFLHLTEVSNADNLEYLLAGVGEALIRNAMLTMETTANGYNEFKTFWDEATVGERGYKALFYDPSWEYDKEFLDRKRQELGRLYEQEYPSSPEQAFIATGEHFFDKLAMQDYLNDVIKWEKEHELIP